MVARSLVTSVLASLLLGSVPAVAIAAGSDGAGDATALAQKDAGRGKAKGKDAAKSFPMKSDEFSRRIENRITKMREKIAAAREKR